MTVFCSPASCTLQVAGRGRVKKNDPWHLDAELLAGCFRLAIAGKTCLETD